MTSDVPACAYTDVDLSDLMIDPEFDWNASEMANRVLPSVENLAAMLPSAAMLRQQCFGRNEGFCLRRY